MEDKTNTLTLPKDLAGYQLVANGEIKPNDIIVNSPFSYPDNSWMVGMADEIVNTPIGKFFIRVYRKSAVPHQYDAHERDDAWRYANALAPKKHDEKPKAKTDDDGKDPLSYLPWDGVRAVSRVQAYGHRKYHDYNNFRKGMEVGRNLSCALRHIASFMEGETNDPESKESHLAHAACRLLFVLQNQHDKVDIDDRYKK